MWHVRTLAPTSSHVSPLTDFVRSLSVEPTPMPDAVRSPSPAVWTEVTTSRPWKKTVILPG